MLFVSFVAATTVATKWLVAGKIMATLGTGFLTAAPAIEKIKRERSKN